MKRLFYLFSLLWCGLFCAVSYAATVDGLYEAEIVAVNQSDSERKRLLPLALRQVLVKVTGEHQLAPEIEELLLPKAARFVQQFRFSNNPEWAEYQAALRRAAETPSWVVVEESKVAEAIENEVLPPEPYLLSVQFDPQMVNQSLNALGVPIWGKERPALLLWLVIDDHGSRTMVGGDELLELQAQIKQQAKQRGVPLWLPMYDFQDTRTGTIGDLWGNFAEPIMVASQRYQADVVILGRIQRLAEQGWQFRWNVLSATGQSASYSDATLLLDGLTTGLDVLLDQQAQRYTQAIGSAEVSRVVVQLLDVDNLASFARASEYLQGLESVKAMQLREISANSMLVELQVLGGAVRLQQLLGLGKRLQPVEDQFSSHQEALLYRLLP